MAAEFHRREFTRALMKEFPSGNGNDQEEWREFFRLVCRHKPICYDTLAAHINNMVGGGTQLNWVDIQEWVEEGDRLLVWQRVLMMIPKHSAWTHRKREKHRKKIKAKKDRKKRDATEFFVAIASAITI